MNLERNMRNIFGHAIFAATVIVHYSFKEHISPLVVKCDNH